MTSQNRDNIRTGIKKSVNKELCTAMSNEIKMQYPHCSIQLF